MLAAGSANGWGLILELHLAQRDLVPEIHQVKTAVIIILELIVPDILQLPVLETSPLLTGFMDNFGTVFFS
jgi:hypothetical protein